MKLAPAILATALGLVTGFPCPAAELTGPPQVGPVETLPLDQVLPGMRATAWTVFQGTTPEPVPVEIIGIMRNVWGPGQDIIMAKLGGQAARTNVAGGMSGSPVYYDGKLLGAISLRFSTFSPDAIAGITPIDLMLEINEFDQGRPIAARSPRLGPVGLAPGSPGLLAGSLAGSGGAAIGAGPASGLAEEIWESASAEMPPESYLTPIETPITVSGVHSGVLDVFGGYFRKQGLWVMQGGTSGPAAGSGAAVQGALRPGEPIAAVLVSGDSSVSALGTVTYNDGQRVLAFGHPLFNLGPIEIPMAKAEVLTVLASQLRPVKVANFHEIVGALRQDRHSGIMGRLGETAAMIPIHVTVRTLNAEDEVLREKQLRYKIIQNQKWTPPLVVMTLYNSMFGLNDFTQESTFRLQGDIKLDGGRHISIRGMRTASESPLPAPLALAGQVGDTFRKLLTHPAESPRFERMDVTIDLLPERRIIVVEQITVANKNVRPGEEVRGKVRLRPYRGSPLLRDFSIKIPVNTPKGSLRLLASDASTVDRAKRMAAGRNPLMTLPETISVLNQKRPNNRLFITLFDSSVTAHFGDKTLPHLPASMLNVMKRTAGRRMVLERQSPLAQESIAFDSIISGSQSITLNVK